MSAKIGGGLCREVVRAVALCVRCCICLHYPSGRGPAPPGGIARDLGCGGRGGSIGGGRIGLRGARRRNHPPEKNGRAAHRQTALRHPPAAATLSWRAGQPPPPRRGG